MTTSLIKNEEINDWYDPFYVLSERKKEREKGIKLSDNTRRERLTKALCLPIDSYN